MRAVIRRKRIAVVGAGRATPGQTKLAEGVGSEIARHDAILLCGGLGGVMHAAARGASAAGGLTIGLLPGYDADAANDAIAVPLPTGLGHARNVVLVASADAVIAIGGGAGTLSEIALALKLGRRVIGLDTWRPQAPDSTTVAIHWARDAAHAVQLALEPEEGAR